jgi:hypothetical protein
MATNEGRAKKRRRTSQAVLNYAIRALACILAICAAACHNAHNSRVAPDALEKAQWITPIDLSNPAAPSRLDWPLEISGAKNEWVSFVVQLQPGELSSESGAAGLQIELPSVDPANITVYQILSVPVDSDRAGYVRHTGLAVGNTQIPRVLLPLPMHDGVVDLSALRDPDRPQDFSARPTGRTPVLLWIDIHIPKDLAANTYSGTCKLNTGRSASLPPAQFSLQVYDFVLPDDRNLVMTSQIGWDALARLYPDRFEAITPRLMNRTDDTYAPAVKTLDQLISLAEANRVCAVAPRLQPTVKWPAGSPPQLDWSDFDSLVSPWLNGDGFADKAPLAYWPLPQIDHLENFDAQDRMDYWSAAAAHFSQQDWLDRSGVVLQTPTGVGNSVEGLSQEAQRVLLADSRVRVFLPLHEDQILFSGGPDSSLIDPKYSGRLMAESTSLVFAAPNSPWDPARTHPDLWLSAGQPGLTPFVGAGIDERDVRLWAWLAFVKHAQMVSWDNPLPQNAVGETADPSEVVWFYPGQWFGVDQPLATLQLKWLRRAEQDYEYLRLAADRGMAANAFMLARLITKQVELQPGQTADPVYSLLCGTVDETSWDQARSLLARTILIRPPGKSADDPTIRSSEISLNLDTIRWQQPKERPYILPRTAQWLWDSSQTSGNHWVYVNLGVDIYNAGDNRPTDNSLQWNTAGPGWEFRPQPLTISTLPTYGVQQFSLSARVDLDRIDGVSRLPLQISFMDGYTRDEYLSDLLLPVAATDRREGKLDIDGKLNDWDSSDQINSGPLTRMLDRPSVQQERTQPASSDCDIYTGWADEDFYVAFLAHGVSAQSANRNFVDYQLRRAWGEDLCQVMIQPIYDDNTLGPVTYLACKPNGVCVVRSRRTEGGDAAPNPWREIDGTSLRYASDPEKDSWGGELAIPWKLLTGNSPKVPHLLRFNFIQHRAGSGESASWAGPIDFDQDESMMGLLFIRDTTSPGTE